MLATTTTITTTLFVPFTDLHDTEKLHKNIERVQATHNKHLGLKR